jgi:uncharacterized membrane protein YhiD involved in acid resistance
VINTETVLIRLGFALLLGGSIGVERAYREHAAGLKTLAHVSLGSLGSALITITSAYGFAAALGLCRPRCGSIHRTSPRRSSVASTY